MGIYLLAYHMEGAAHGYVILITAPATFDMRIPVVMKKFAPAPLHIRQRKKLALLLTLLHETVAFQSQVSVVSVPHEPFN